MPLTRMKDDYTMSDGVKFWMADEGRPVLCRVTHEALRDHSDRVRFNVADDKVFEAYRELIEQVAAPKCVRSRVRDVRFTPKSGNVG
jgi:hypothetical protein